MSERPSVDSAALRRETRRRKILENSEKRLRSITGRQVSEPSEARQETRNCFLYDFQNQHVNDAFGETDENLPHELEVEQDFLAHKPHVNDVEDDALFIITAKEPNGFGSTWMKTLIHKRFHFIILSVIVQLLYILKLGHLFYNNLFCPFITVKLMEFWLVHEPFKMDNQEQFVLMSTVFNGSMARHMLRAFCVFAYLILQHIYKWMGGRKMIGTETEMGKDEEALSYKKGNMEELRIHRHISNLTNIYKLYKNNKMLEEALDNTQTLELERNVIREDTAP